MYSQFLFILPPTHKMGNLSELPYDLLQIISERLKKFEDFVSFRCVAKSLYSAVKDESFVGLRLRQRLPHLLLPVKDDDDDDVRDLYSLVEGESIVASLRLPSFKDSKCLESLGWLIAVQGDGNMSLLAPFSGTEIPLPHQKTLPGYHSCEMNEHMFIQRMVLSAKPNETLDFILMVICGSAGHLAFWRLGDKAWNRIDQRRGPFVDVVHYGEGVFYAIGTPGCVWIFQLAKEGNAVEGGCFIDCEPVLPYYGLPQSERPYPAFKLYLLKADDGKLLIITRTNAKLNEDRSAYLTTKFQVYEVDRKKKTWKEIYSLGRMAVFVGHNSTMALDAFEFPGGVIEANHIYFTDDDWEWYFYISELTKVGGLNMGVYNMETGSIEPFYDGEPMLNKISTSLWINPPRY